MTELMRAWALKDFDHRADFTDLPVPQPGLHQVRVRVRASSVNPVDVATSTGAFRGVYEYRFPATQGRDFAGTIDAVGPEVTKFRPGDEVFGMVKRDYVGDGTFAEFVVLDEDRFVVPRPPEVSLADAGALGLAGVTALQCIEALGLEAGATIFINGATGGVGAFAIQAASATGLDVVATARPGDEDEHVQELGAAASVDWSSGDVTAAIRHVRPQGVQGVIDLVSRDATTFARIAALATGAAVSTLGAAEDESTVGPRTMNVHSDSDPKLLHRIAQLVATGSVRVPLVDKFPFDRIDSAFSRLAASPRGKVGLVIG